MPLDFFRIPELTAKEDKLYQTVCGYNNITDTMKFMSNPRSRLDPLFCRLLLDQGNS